jgi:hypothetical protein
MRAERIDMESRGYEGVEGAIEGEKGSNVAPLAHGLDHGGEVERALASALTEAARAGQWAIVAQLAKELEALRLG